MAFTPSEVEMIDRLERTIMRNAGSDELMLRYYQGRQRVEQLGMAIPPNMRRFLVVANWPRVVVDTTDFAAALQRPATRRQFRLVESADELTEMLDASLDKWRDYTEAKEAMFLHTDTSDAPWTVIKSDCKKRARLNAMRFVLSRIPYTKRDPGRIGAVDPLIVGRPGLAIGGGDDQLAIATGL